MAPANNDGNTGLIPRFLGQALFNSFATSELLLVFLEANRKAAVADRIGTVSGNHGGLAPAKVERLSYRASLCIALAASASLYGLAYLIIREIIHLVAALV
jgi:hypothetical protein